MDIIQEQYIRKDFSAQAEEVTYTGSIEGGIISITMNGPVTNRVSMPIHLLPKFLEFASGVLALED